MANTSDARSHNQPSKDAQIKGGQHSHQGSEKESTGSSGNTANQSAGNMNDERMRNQPGQNQPGQKQPSHEAQIKGGQHSHSGGKS